VRAAGGSSADVAASRQLELLWGSVAVLCLAALSLVARLGPGVEAGLFTWLPACPVKALAGLPCPTCGATRATLALSHLDLFAAFAWNPLVALAWGLLIVGGLGALLRAWGRRPLPSLPRRLAPWQRWALLLVVAANWIYLLGQGI
jgi:hypothetical protein